MEDIFISKQRTDGSAAGSGDVTSAGVTWSPLAIDVAGAVANQTPYLGPPPNRCQAQRRAADRSIPALKRRFDPDSAKQKSTMSVDFGTSRRAAQAARACFGVIAYGSIARRAPACGETAKLLYVVQT
jgi:hypothetical protein